MFSIRRIAIVLAVASLFAAGCGGDTAAKNKYVEANNKIQQQAATAASGISISGDPKSSTSRLQAASDEFEKAVVKLDALEAPDDWKDQHAKLVKSLKQQHAAMERSIAAAKKGDATTATAEINKITEYSKDTQEAIDAMNGAR